ncbi:MAG: serine O-acetyltransferase [Clostridia bacterium]|nr:serine O-acetyltransferase [Clostridia bacterium]MBQ5819620.1 serine O-acetyltransferase [Clostridia bacterium]
MFKKLRYDIQAIRERDPAAKSNAEVFFCYPGLHVLIYHRIAKFFYRHNHKLLARMISQHARRRTGIEIHPGATIGKGLFIDHGMGVVIGETAEIGDNCTIYHGVTLGGTGKETGKRHPTIGNNVFIGAHSQLLGSFTVGDNVKIAAGSVVLEDIPANCTAVGSPARIVKRDGVRIDNFDNVHIPDPVSQEFCRMRVRIDRLQQQLEESRDGQPSADHNNEN